MSPVMEPDFDWAEDVQAAVPIYDKGVYELSVKSVRGAAWQKTDDNGNPIPGAITRTVRVVPEMVGVQDSKGKLDTTDKGNPVEALDLWVHTEGGRRQAKQRMMAIFGYDPYDHEVEKEFNNFLKTSKLDMSVKLEEDDEGKFTLKLGEGWEKLVGKNFISHLEPETQEREGREPIIRQNFTRVLPVNSD